MAYDDRLRAAMKRAGMTTARLTARTPDERALVSQAAAAQAQRDKQARLAEENRRFTEHTQEQIKRMKR